MTLVLKGQNQQQFHDHMRRIHAGEKAHLQHAEYERLYGASAADLQHVKSFAASHQLSVESEDAARRTVVLNGTVEKISAAFGVRFVNFEHGSTKHRGYHGQVMLPSTVAEVVESVLGLDNRPIARPHFQYRDKAAAAAQGQSLAPKQVAQLYGFPTSTGGAGGTVALIELGGGYHAKDLTKYWKEQGVSPAPKVVAVPVDGGKNTPGSDADGEVQLDIEVVGCIASSSTIAVYFAPNTDAGFLAAITSATQDKTHNPSVMSISWGSAESTWPAATQTSFDNALAAAAVLGISVFVASGDNGSTDGESDGSAHVDFPASSPHVTGCGGTTLTGSGSSISSEVVWNGSGGGVSATFALPTWQSGLKDTPTSGSAATLAKRGVPDVCGNADPNTGYIIDVNGQSQVVGGTSAVAPLWAALTSITNAAHNTRLGLINPQLYATTSQLRDITSGNNGGFQATTGWDACSGLGSPNTTALQSTPTQPTQPTQPTSST